MDEYSSRGSSVHPVKKYHGLLAGAPLAIEGPPASDLEVIERKLHSRNYFLLPFLSTFALLFNDFLELLFAAGAVEVKGDEFWDYEKQVDLESFSSKTLYDILSKQSKATTQELSKQKDEIKHLYRKVANENDSLRGLWAAKLNLSGKGGRVTREDMRDHEERRARLESEIERRRELGRVFEKVLIRIREVQDADEKEREEHQVSIRLFTQPFSPTFYSTLLSFMTPLLL